MISDIFDDGDGGYVSADELDFADLTDARIADLLSDIDFDDFSLDELQEMLNDLE